MNETILQTAVAVAGLALGLQSLLLSALWKISGRLAHIESELAKLQGAYAEHCRNESERMS